MKKKLGALGLFLMTLGSVLFVVAAHTTSPEWAWVAGWGALIAGMISYGSTYRIFNLNLS